MYYMNHDAVDYFSAAFTPKDSIVGGVHHPLGFYAAAALETVYSRTADIRIKTECFKKGFQLFLAARSPSSAAVARQSLKELWRTLRKLPVFSRLLADDDSPEALLPYLREHPDEADDMLTPETSRNAAYVQWINKLTSLPDVLEAFVRNTEWMLESYFEDLPSRRREAYADAFGSYRRDICRAISFEEESGEKNFTVDLDSVCFDYPVNLSFIPSVDPETGELVLAEQIIFESLVSFLYLDLYKGMAAGNLPRRCRHCYRWFLAVGAYNTLYCDRKAPGMGGKACREVGAHEKEKSENKKAARREYSRIYNRLKARKQRGKLSTDEWNRQVVQAQELRSEFEKGGLTEEEYVEKLDGL